MSVLSLSYWESGVYWRQTNKHFAELAPQNGGKQLIWRNYVTVTLYIQPIWQQIVSCKRGFNWSLFTATASVSSDLTAFCKVLLLPPPRRICFRRCVFCLFVCMLATLCKNFQTDLHESFRECWQWANEQMIKFWWRYESPSGYRDCFPDSSLLGDTESG